MCDFEKLYEAISYKHCLLKNNDCECNEINTAILTGVYFLFSEPTPLFFILSPMPQLYVHFSKVQTKMQEELII